MYFKSFTDKQNAGEIFAGIFDCHVRCCPLAGTGWRCILTVIMKFLHPAVCARTDLVATSALYLAVINGGICLSFYMECAPGTAINP